MTESAAGKEVHRVAEDDRGKVTGGKTSPCKCGCGTEVRRTFAQGHDQVFLAHLRSEVSAGRMSSDEALAEASGVSSAFVKKVSRSMAIVVSQRARESRKESPMAAAPAA